MKTMSWTICHYGSDYIGYAIRSVYDFVDECHVSYTSRPSHGADTKMRNPDTKEKIQESLYQFGDPKNKIKWSEGAWHNEGSHRDTAFHIAKRIGAEAIVVVDCDEVWQAKGLSDSLAYVPEAKHRSLKSWMIHFWRSFGWVNKDAMQPDRIYKVSGDPRSYGYLPTGDSPILHFGYARSLADVIYKTGDIHGHRAEFKCGWLENTFKPWRGGCGMVSVHPTCDNTWTPERYDKTTLPDLLKKHPYYNLDLIE